MQTNNFNLNIGVNQKWSDLDSTSTKLKKLQWKSWVMREIQKIYFIFRLERKIFNKVRRYVGCNIPSEAGEKLPLIKRVVLPP